MTFTKQIKYDLTIETKITLNEVMFKGFEILNQIPCKILNLIINLSLSIFTTFIYCIEIIELFYYFYKINDNN